MPLVLASDLLELASDISIDERGNSRVQHGQVLALGSDACLGRRPKIAVAP